MYTSNMFMNYSNYNRFSQTPQENHDKSEWMECPKNEREWSIGNVVELKTEYEKSKLTHKDYLKQTCLGTDNIKDMPTYGRSKTERFGARCQYGAEEILSEWRKSYSGTNDYGTKLTNLHKSIGLPSNVDRISSYTDNANRGPIVSRDGGLTLGDGMQKREDDFISGTGKKPDGLPPVGGKKGKETDNNDKDWSERSPFEPMDITKKIGNAAKNISQSVVSNIVSESLCSVIDSSREKGFQNTDIPKILTNAVGNSMQTIKDEGLKESTSFLSEWLPTVAPQLKCVESPLKKFSFIWELISVLRDYSKDRITLWQIVKWFFSKAVYIGIELFISSIFGPVGCVFATLISIFKNVITHLIKSFI
ncbi:uncharacterized protein LOC143081725 [Mytilus galloprovincialis]|uniref:uncharacterized protein LOC143081725 n=1 Tax=Mytilus galloprovincialis TaxID=29158 RepID=UPI003F7CA83D